MKYVPRTTTEEERIERFDSYMSTMVTPEFRAWLVSNGFFLAPAASKHHGNYEGGLFDHSCEVMEALVEASGQLGIKWQKQSSPFIVGMFHDLCKIDSYKKAPEGAENEFEYGDVAIIQGHGDKSIMYLCQHMQLTEEEVLCIRYHMGAYETKDWDSFDKAIRKYQTVLFTHTADMFASKVRDV